MERYEDFYGCVAYIKPQGNGNVLLTIWSGTRRIFRKAYNSYRGAKIAMGQQSDCWERKEA